jgi:hypothetical protein
MARDEFACGGVPCLELAVSRQHMQALFASCLVEDRIWLMSNPSQGDPVGVQEGQHSYFEWSIED